MSRTKTLRPYPYHGKFEGGFVVDEVAHRAVLAGAEESTGEYSLLVGGLIPSHFEASDIDLTPEELEFLGGVAGAIVREDSQGFVRVNWFDTQRDLEFAWRAIREGYIGYAVALYAVLVDIESRRLNPNRGGTQ